MIQFHARYFLRPHPLPSHHHCNMRKKWKSKVLYRIYTNWHRTLRTGAPNKFATFTPAKICRQKFQTASWSAPPAAKAALASRGVHAAVPPRASNRDGNVAPSKEIACTAQRSGSFFSSLFALITGMSSALVIGPCSFWPFRSSASISSHLRFPPARAKASAHLRLRPPKHV